MNCPQIEPLVLLQDSGEISEDQQQELASHLNTCADCRKLKTDLDRLRQTLHEGAHDLRGPSRHTLTLIRKAAKRRRSPAPWVMSAPWRIALATAASLILCLTTLQFIHSPPPPADQPSLATEIIPLIAIITGSESGHLALEGENTELTVLANELLRLQEMSFEWPVDKKESPIPPEDYQPTTLQWNNSPGSLSGRYG